MTGLTVALDAMGGDFGPQVTVPAAVQALLQYPSLNLLLFGDQSAITTQLSSLNSTHHPRLTVVHCDHAIADHTRPSQALRQSQGSSMRRALDAVAEGDADACVSAGNTGALMALARYTLKQLPGVERPALVSAIPSRNGGKTWLLDLGANVSCDADTLFQFAVMGSVLAEQEMTGRPPRVALLNIGSEEIKGNDLVKRCASMLSRSPDVHYIGYVEGNELYDGKADVVVCDGFVGNVSLKTSEGVANLFIESFKQAVSQHPIKRLIAKWLFSDLFRQIQSLNPDQYNGASLLGLRGIVVKSHGSADIAALTNAIGEAVHEIKRKIPAKISDRLEHVLLERHF
ncbi:MULTISPECIES: phosphate acyltransferase PlsX [Photobacterium]|uniref:Phosphate acyltransferase n=1 Tax=Photobacterium halotolerans TaxID=265726 RepID=A0A0F5VHH4_9GAMM|nr:MULTISPECIES: phosphate acyltransferase PlsX [Photobacterium]KKD01277.1 phosphate acyltransferase [Photobacterium halotolerans]UIP27049.1 phosphate acyltransferase PlsX [Photobacterium sp. TLY01]